MSRYYGPRVKILRRLGKLDGLRRNGQSIRSKNSSQKGNVTPKIGPYKLRLLEKQKLRYNYGVTERQLFRYVKTARKSSGSVGLAIIKFLELRIDTIVFRLGWGNSIAEARQLVNHGHIKINDKKVNIPSFQCKIGDKIEINDKIFNTKKDKLTAHNLPKFLEISQDKKSGKLIEDIEKDNFLVDIDELLIVEYYSRR